MKRRTKADPATDARKHEGLAFWAWQWHTPLMPVGRFIDAVDKGNVPASDDMAYIAAALRELFCHRDTEATMHAVSRRLGAIRDTGRREITGEEGDHMCVAAIAMVHKERQLVRDGIAPRAARAQAVREIAEQHRVARRTAQAWRKENDSIANAVLNGVEKITSRKTRASKPTGC